MLYDPKRSRQEGLSKSALQVLAVINQLQQAGWPVTLRAISKQMGWHNSQTGYLSADVLPRLEAHGLIEREGRKGGTIRSKCSIIVFREDQ